MKFPVEKCYIEIKRLYDLLVFHSEPSYQKLYTNKVEFAFSSELLDVLESVQEVLVYMSKHRWHDARKYPEDLPEGDEEVLIYDFYDVAGYMTIDADSKIWKNKETIPKAWKYIEPFEGDKNE